MRYSYDLMDYCILYFEGGDTMKYMKQLSIALTVYLIVFVLDFIRTLFTIQHSGVVYTMLGMRSTTKMTAHTLENVFLLTYKSALTLIVFVAVWMGVYFLINRKHA